MTFNKFDSKKSFALLLFYFIGYTVILSSIPFLIAGFLIGLNVSGDYLNSLTIIFQSISLAILTYLSKDFLKLELKSFKENFVSTIIKVPLYYIGMYIINILISLVFNLLNATNSNQVLIEELLNTATSSYVFLAVIVAPIIEEIIFRAVIFRNLYEKNKLIAYIVSSFLFGLLHVIGSLASFNMNDFMYIFVYMNMGLWLSYSYAKHKNIFTSILFHMLNNIIAVAIILII